MDFIMECILLAIKAWLGSIFITIGVGFVGLCLATIAMALTEDD